jgi:peptide/nickel transport system ATP-binding protein
VDQYPHEFSGGMRQRALIAMALVNNPRLLVADEPTTALDVTVQAEILDLLTDLRREFQTAIILVTHDFGVVGSVADRVLVMYAGRVVEQGSVEQLLRRPEHPYSWGLLACVPRLHGPSGADLVPIGGDPPSLISPPAGCAFHPRCRYADRNDGRCGTERPTLLDAAEPGHTVACHLSAPTRISIRARRPAGTGTG